MTGNMQMRHLRVRPEDHSAMKVIRSKGKKEIWIIWLIETMYPLLIGPLSSIARDWVWSSPALLNDR